MADQHAPPRALGARPLPRSLVDRSSVEHLAKSTLGGPGIESERAGSPEESEGAVDVDDGDTFGPSGERAIDRVVHVVDHDRVAIKGEILHALRRTNTARGLTDRFVQHPFAGYRHRPIAIPRMSLLHVNQHEVRTAGPGVPNLFQPTGCFTERGSSPRPEDEEDRPLPFRIRDPHMSASVRAGHTKVRHRLPNDHARRNAFDLRSLPARAVRSRGLHRNLRTCAHQEEWRDNQEGGGSAHGPPCYVDPRVSLRRHPDSFENRTSPELNDPLRPAR